ncbi:MAG TPA: hypothetical protein VFO39_20490 [Candidatus Sulfotelmatobacter sp.]|nr:hypothetical protein [Candidatus Sulfotelmatobacter sp.]
MPDPTPEIPATQVSARQASPSAPAPPPASQTQGPTINIGDEFGTAKKNLPPAKIVVPAIVVVGIIIAIIALTVRTKPQGTGSLDNVVAVEVPGQTTTLVALTFTLHNATEKILYVRTLQGKIKTSGGEITGDAVSAVDFDRYFQAFPTLKEGTQPALSPETQLPPGQSVRSTIIVSFPISQDTFNQRQSISAVIQPYDQPIPVVLTK